MCICSLVKHRGDGDAFLLNSRHSHGNTHMALAPMSPVDMPGGSGDLQPHSPRNTDVISTLVLPPAGAPVWQPRRRGGSRDPGQETLLSGPIDLTPLPGVLGFAHPISSLSKLPSSWDPPEKSGSSPQWVQRFTVDRLPLLSCQPKSWEEEGFIK